MTEPASEPKMRSEVDPRLSSAMEHVQRAALEMIAAMRNALDVTEDLIGDPHALQGLLQGAVEAAKAAAATVTTAATAAATTTVAGNAERVQRIRVED